MIRPAMPGDETAMGRILSAWIDETPWMPRLHKPEEDRAFCASLMPHAFIAGEREGFIAVENGHIAQLQVAAPARGQGLGRALVDHAKTLSPVLDCWTFEANAPARAFWWRMGFAPVGGSEGDNEEGLPDIHLEWRRA